MIIRTSFIFKLFVFILAVFLYCEYIVYYIVLFQCSWPAVHNTYNDEKPVYALFLADPHLLGNRNGHWFDKLRREWQMHRAFQTALTLHRPEVVFILGDLFDEGLWATEVEFNTYVERFKYLFAVPNSTKLYVAVGNHDVGFHYRITPHLSNRFTTKLNSPPVQFVSIRGNHFVVINSMAMEGDGCFLCHRAEVALNNITSMLRCSKGVGSCHHTKRLDRYSRPILLQHFPLYRVSDEICTESDSAPLKEKKIKFRERWECLSRESSEFLVDNLQPRVVLGGHTHHSCFVQHSTNFPSSSEKIIEYSVPSFSWRNRNDPSYMLGVFTPDNYKVMKCRMPKESSVVNVYIFSGIIVVVSLLCYIKKKQSRYVGCRKQF